MGSRTEPEIIGGMFGLEEVISNVEWLPKRVTD